MKTLTVIAAGTVHTRKTDLPYKFAGVLRIMRPAEIVFEVCWSRTEKGAEHLLRKRKDAHFQHHWNSRGVLLRKTPIPGVDCEEIGVFPIIE